MPHQSDAADMGMSYEELGDLGYCRKVEHCGPLSTFLKLRDRWNDGREISPSIRATGVGQKADTSCITASGIKGGPSEDRTRWFNLATIHLTLGSSGWQRHAERGC